MSKKKVLALVVTGMLMVGCLIGGTLAWLTDSSDSVTNTFTESDIDISLNETKNDFKMIPGWTIEKDPVVEVADGSEDCWLFVKITESQTPKLDDYISYAIAAGWETVQEENNNGEIVIARRVYKDDVVKEFPILGGGSYEDLMDSENADDNFTITWGQNQVCVKPSVTEQMMEATKVNRPTLSFQAYAVQLYKTNSDGNKNNTEDEFTWDEAWAQAQAIAQGN